jgi:NADPH-dependent F420 reductase
MKIAIIGTGTVGGTLGRRFAALGHEVAFGSRSNKAVKGGLPANAALRSVEDAAREADVIVLTVPGSAVLEVARSIAPASGKIVVDVTNPLVSGVGGLSLDVGPHGESGAELVAAALPQARVVKAFNQTGAENMANPLYDGAASVMFYAGDDKDAKGVVGELVRSLGFDAIDAGGLSRSRELEHLAMLWIALAYGGLGRNIAFRLVRR